jgi:hypothetical protein
MRKITEKPALLAGRLWYKSFRAVDADHVSEGVELVHSCWL